jgi:hypothetical protein
MPRDRRMNRPCTLLLRSQTEEDDDFTAGDEDEAPERETFCYFEQRSRDEVSGQGELSATEWLFVFPRGTTLATRDAIRVEGEGVFELTGDPWGVWDDARGRVDHVEATAVRVGEAQEDEGS